jgi:hypothetical protein
MPIAKKLALIMGEVDRIPKNGRNDFHKYDYATEADLVQAIRGSMSKHGVAFLPTVKSWEQKGDITSAEVEFHFIDSEDGTELVSTFWGFGQDKGDKGAYKAYTGAVKYCLMKTFLVPTGDDPEAHEQQDTRKPQGQTRQQQQTRTEGGGSQPAPNANSGPRKVIETPPATKEEITAMLNERKRREDGWVPILEALKAKGMPDASEGATDQEKSALLDEYMAKLTKGDVVALTAKLKALPFKGRKAEGA